MFLLKKIYSSVPLKVNEISRFLLISLMMLMILFIYSIQRNIKDAIQKGRVYWHEYNANGIWDHETRDQHLNDKKEK